MTFNVSSNIVYRTKEEFLLALRASKNQIAKADNCFIDEDGNFLFGLNTKFRWGKHKGNLLKDVYKVDPYYILWCINKVSGFGVYEPHLRELQTQRVFEEACINKLIVETQPEIYTIDLSFLNRNINGFLMGNKDIIEVDFILPEELISHNLTKIKNGISDRSYQFGVPEGNEERSLFFQKGFSLKLLVK